MVPGMARTLTPDEAVERAQRVQQERIETVRGLAHARQDLVEVRADADRRRAALERELAARISAAERADQSRYAAAVSAGWTTAVLRKIGFDEPDRADRARQRAARKPRTTFFVSN